MSPTVLLIDDNDVDREAVRRMLDRRFRLVEAATAQEGVEQVEPHAPDCVLLDHGLPDTEGLRLLEWFVDGRIPTILLTGQGSEFLAANAMKRGAADYLVKGGLTGAQLNKAIQYTIERSRLERELEGRRDEVERQLGEVREREAYIQGLLGAIPDDIRILDQDAVCRDVVQTPQDPEVAALPWPVGATAAEALPTEVAREFEALVASIGTGGPTRRIEFALTGPERIFESRLSAANGRILLISRDVTRQRRLERQLQVTNRLEAVGRLAGGIAHDFNNLLTVMLNQTEFVRMQLPEGHGAGPALDGVTEACRRAADLVAQLVTFSRRRRVAPQIVPVNRVVSDVRRMVDRVLGEDIQVELSLASGVGAIQVDPGALEQALLNLAVNARDAMPRGGRLTLTTARIVVDEEAAHRHVDMESGTYVVITVSDTGVGMDAETRQRCFEPFYTTKPDGRGTGLGLATCYGTVRQAGGHIWVYSEPGLGTSFKMYFPLAGEGTTARPAPARRSRPLPSRVRGAEAHTILVVEDEPAVRALVVRVLRSRGYRVIEAATGLEALQVMESRDGRLDLVVTDMVMPQMSGPALVERLATHYPEVRVLFMSGFADHRAVLDGVDASTPYLEKPFMPADLAEAVRKALA